MSSTALKITAAIMVLLAVVLGAVTVKVFRQNAQVAQAAAARSAEQSRAPQVFAVVAIKPLAAYQPIDRAAIALAPLAVAPAQYFTNIDEVAGKLPLQDIDTGAPVTQRYFKESNVLARTIPAGFKAVSLEVNDVIAVGGFLRPGDIVDVLLFLRSGSGVEQAQARVLLKQVRLLAYEDRIIDRPEGLKDAENKEAKQRRIRTAVLAVPEAETTRVMLGASLGEVRLALNGSADADAPSATEAAATDQTVTAAQLARTSAPSNKNNSNSEQPAPSVEVYRGSTRERVITK